MTSRMRPTVRLKPVTDACRAGLRPIACCTESTLDLSRFRLTTHRRSSTTASSECALAPLVEPRLTRRSLVHWTADFLSLTCAHSWDWGPFRDFRSTRLSSRWNALLRNLVRAGFSLFVRFASQGTHVRWVMRLRTLSLLSYLKLLKRARVFDCGLCWYYRSSR